MFTNLINYVIDNLSKEIWWQSSSKTLFEGRVSNLPMSDMASVALEAKRLQLV